LEGWQQRLIASPPVQKAEKAATADSINTALTDLKKTVSGN
jgi:hypothetical protein